MAANDPRQPGCGWQEKSAAFAGAILTQCFGNRLANEPAIRAQPNSHRLRSSAVYLAAITLTALCLQAFFPLRWLDPVAALCAIPILIVEGRRAFRGESCGCC